MMTDHAHSEESRLLTDLVLEVFGLNGALLASGDTLVRDLDLTSARWQVLGAIALEDRPLTVAQAARRMGLTRQAVQRVMRDLEADGFVSAKSNPDHKRAPLFMLTEKGQKAYAEADRRQIGWSQELAAGVKREELKAALNLLRRLNARCNAR
jgi:DNA-binding MarR family transcriptional regulator